MKKNAIAIKNSHRKKPSTDWGFNMKRAFDFFRRPAPIRLTTGEKIRKSITNAKKRSPGDAIAGPLFEWELGISGVDRSLNSIENVSV
ncbi:hypothetical protein D3C72_1958280 [compost metagenome]